MCGIAGILSFSADFRPDRENLVKMCDAMRHRGPDDQGVYCSDRVGMAMCRLSIVDLSTGHQPMCNEDGTVWIVFNGEIYNHAALRERLQASGHRYRTRSDTETIIHAYEEYGSECVQHLRGMFAFAIWDGNRRKMFVARDRFGIKPFYYRISENSLLFGSEIKTLFAHPGVKPEFNRKCLPEYLAFGYLSGQETFYNEISKLPPAHIMEIDCDGSVETRPYWDLDLSEEPPSDDHPEQYRDLLERSVSSHLMSDVPVGVFLSGGLDSSIIAALMTKLRGEPIETFSVGYAEEQFSELPNARRVAHHLNSQHYECLLSERKFFDSLAKLIWHEDEPLAWPSSVSLYFVSQLARSRVKVVLTGEGSDETLGGYTRYAFTLKHATLDRAYRKVTPDSVRRWVRSHFPELPFLSATVKRKLSHTCLAHDGALRTSFYCDNFFSAFAQQQQKRLLTERFQEECDGNPAYDNVVNYWEQSSGSTLQRLLYTDIKTYLTELLMKQDQMSMAASIESRVPFLDHELAQFAVKVPARKQIEGMSGKWILKKASEDLLPKATIYAPKLGFPTPWQRWLDGPRLEAIQDLLLDARSMDRGFFEADVIKRLFHEHRQGYHDHYDRIWRLLNLELWQRVCLEEGFEPVSSEPVETKLVEA